MRRSPQALDVSVGSVQRYTVNPPVGASLHPAPLEPDKRTIQRLSFVPRYDHDMADRKARGAWFDQHPEARPECYPEPPRPDRMGL